MKTFNVFSGLILCLYFIPSLSSSQHIMPTQPDIFNKCVYPKDLPGGDGYDEAVSVSKASLGWGNRAGDACKPLGYKLVWPQKWTSGRCGLIHSYFFCFPVWTSQTSLDESVFLVNKPQLHNGAPDSRKTAKWWCSEKINEQGREKKECKPPELTCWSETQWAMYIKKKSTESHNNWNVNGRGRNLLSVSGVSALIHLLFRACKIPISHLFSSHLWEIEKYVPHIIVF